MQDRDSDGDDAVLEPIKPLDTSSVQERLTDEIRRLIIEGQLKPKARISEYALAQAFGVSRTPVREGLKQLKVEGLVEIVPRVGTFVAQPSWREITELFALKEVLEGLAARLLAQARPKEALDVLEANLREARTAVEQGDAERYAELVHAFHAAIIEGCDSGALRTHHRTLMNQLGYERLVLTTVRQPGRLERSLEEHARVLELVQAGDSHAAELAMRDHVAASHRELAAGLLRQRDAEPTDS